MKLSKKRTRGSMLVGTVVATLVIALAIGSLLQYVANSYRNSMRQRKLFQVKTAAESEMEYLFYTWKTTVLNNASAAVSDVGMRTIPGLVMASQFNHTGGNWPGNWTLSTQVPISSSMPGMDTYTATRTIAFDPNVRMPGLTNTIPAKTGQMSYFVAQSSINYTDPMLGPINVNMGRRFIYSETSLFQYSVFYQGDMEFSTGTNMTINGDISSNSSIYLGVGNSRTLLVNDKVRFAAQFNGSADPTLGTLRTMTTANNSMLADATFATSRASQAEKLNEVENFTGGIDIDSAIAAHPAVYNGDGNLASITDADRNMVYRSVISPPPVDAMGNLVPEDATIAARRMYNRAGLIIQVSTVGGVDTINAYASVGGVQTNITSTLLGAGVIPNVREVHYDYREGQKVKMTSVDVGALKTLVESRAIPALNSSYNGFVYVYDTDPAHTDGVTPSNSYKAGVRLVNASNVPDVDQGQIRNSTPTGEYTGFTVATDNGLYVQGNYNTVPKSLLPSMTPKSAALLGDAVTVLSKDWTAAYSDTSTYGVAQSRRAGSAAATVDTFENNGFTTVVAAIISGNTPTVGPAGAPTSVSGGVQNLVRYLEDWYTPNQSVKLLGSLGQLFNSSYFNSPYSAGVYGAPRTRDFTFDDNLAKNPKGGWPSTTAFFRGDYYTW